MRNLLAALALLAADSAHAYPGPQINGGQINPQTGISIATFAVTGAGDTSIANSLTASSFTATGNGFKGAGTGLTGTAASLTAGNVTTNANLTGNVTSVGNATTIAVIPAVSGANLTNLTGANVTGTVPKATALNATPTKCSAGNYPLGVDASGNAQNCTAAGTGDVTQSGNNTMTGTNSFTGQVKVSSGFVINLAGANFSSTQSSFLPAASVTGSTGSFTVQGTTVACWFQGGILSTIQGNTAHLGLGMDGVLNTVPGTSVNTGVLNIPVYFASYNHNFDFYREFQVTGGGVSHAFWLGVWNNGGTSTLIPTGDVGAFGCREVPSR